MPKGMGSEVRRPRDPEALYQRALGLVDPSRRGRTARDLERARNLLVEALRMRRNFAAAHSLLAYVDIELDNPGTAVRALRVAVRLKPRNRTYRRFLLELLDRAGLVRQLRAELPKAAAVENVDLASIRCELLRAGLPADASTVRLNAFPAGKAHFESDLLDAVENLRRDSVVERDHVDDARAARQAVRIDGRRVPPALRKAIGLARQWGIPDDAYRADLTSRISSAERAAMRRVLSISLRRRINAWLDTFHDTRSLSAEATHFMYLLEAFDEIFQRRR